MISKKRKEKLEKNIWKFYLYRVFCSMFFAVPIFILFLQDNGLSMTQIAFLESAYTVTVMITIVPFGIAGDYIGRKKMLVGNTIFFVAGFIIYATGYSFWQFLLAEMILALSSAAWESAREPFFYDNLKELGQESKFKRLFGRVVGINSIGFAVASLAGGFMASYSLRLPILLTAVPAFFGLLVSFSFTDTKRYKHGEKNYLNHLKKAASFTAKHKKIRFFIAYSAIIFAVMTAGFLFYQPYLKSIGIPIVYFGLIYAAMGGAAAIGGRYADNIERTLGEKKILVILLLVMILSFIGMAKVSWTIGLIFPVIIGFIGGLFEPVIADYIHKHVKSHNRGTVGSISNLTTKGAIVASAPFFGWVVDIYSLSMAFMLASAILILDIFILSLIYVIGWRRMRKDEDKEI
ncbi:MFS transporter [Candidatus Woesearchaeota archaeon]|nr:MFS transporter [Candidatus Woesearchaeota archaeon]